MADEFKSEVIPLDEGLPNSGERVIVFCRQFSILGFRDERGVWREERHPDETLMDVVAWRRLSSVEEYTIQSNSDSYAARITFGRLRA